MNPSRWAMQLAPVMLLTLAGCAVSVPTPLDRTVPATWMGELPSGRPTVDPAAWWRIYNDAQLDALVQEALGANLDVAQAVSRLRQERLLRGATQAGFMPQVSAGVRTLQDIAALDSYFHASLDVVWEMGLFGLADATNQAAQAAVQMARADAQSQRVLVVADVVRNYLDMRTAQSQRFFIQQQLVLAERSSQLQQVRKDLGLPLAVQTRAELLAHMGQLRAQLSDLAARQFQSAQSLAILLNRQQPDAAWLEAGKSGRVVDAPAFSMAQLPADLLRSRPDIHATESAVLKAAAGVGMAEAALRPRVMLAGSLLFSYNITQNSRTTRDLAPAIGPLIDIPLFDWSQRVSRRDASQEALNEASLAYRKAVLVGVGEAQAALNALGHQRARSQTLAETAQALNAQVQTHAKRVQLGLGSELEMTQLQRTALQAQADAALAQSAQSLAVVALFKALGGAPLPLDAAEDTVASVPQRSTP